MDTLKAAAKVTDDYKAFYPQSQPQFDLWIRPNEANDSPATAIPYGRRVNMTVDDGWFVIIVHAVGFRPGAVGASARAQSKKSSCGCWRMRWSMFGSSTPANGRKCPMGNPASPASTCAIGPRRSRKYRDGQKEQEPEKPSTH